jgi:hypothetical protein
MMKTKGTVNKEYSKEIRDILEKEPAWIIRNGMWIIMAILSLMILGFFAASKVLTK